MRPRDDPTERRHGPTGRRRRPSARERPRTRRRTETPLRGRGRRTRASPALVPGATLAALAVVAVLAAVRGASGVLREWSLAIAVFTAAVACLLGTVVVAHLAAGVAAYRSDRGR